MTSDARERLAELTAVPPEVLAHWSDEGLVDIGVEPTPRVLAEIRLLQLLVRRGFEVTDIAAALRSQPGLFDQYVSLAEANDAGIRTVEEAATVHGLDLEFVRRIWEASGLADQGEVGTDEDVESMRALGVALEAGFPPDAMVQLVRVYADATARIAEATTRLFHFHIHERLRAEGFTGAALVERTTAASSDLLPFVEPAVLYYHRKALIRAFREDLAVHLAEESGLVTAGDTSGRVTLTVLFVDLARFTAMTESMGDLAAAEVLDRFSQMVRRAVVAAGGRVVKQIGDEFMLVFGDPTSAVRAGLRIRQAALDEPAFLATRLGVHHGPVLCREGDYVGTTVNIAARITAEAAPHQLLVSQTVRDVAALDLDVAITAVGARALKGLVDHVALFEVTDEAAPVREAMVDPVCGMILDPATATVRLEVNGVELVFCSQNCLDRYSVDADRRAAGPV